MSKESNKKTVYAPKIRTSYRPKKKDLISYGKNLTNFTYLPNPVTDDIVVNNISYQEFDYIEDPNYISALDDDE